MKNFQNLIPGYRIYDYMLVLSPHEELRNKINMVKKNFAEEFKTNHALHDRPHIMIASFTQYGQAEEKIINRLKAIAMGYHTCKIELKDFASFPSHTIYINVTSKIPIQDLSKTIRREAQALMKLDNEHKPYFPNEPYIGIGRKLQPWQYEKGWNEFSHKHFTGRFIADGMLLLKRQVGEKPFQIVQRFDFENLPVTTKQGELFA